MHLNQLLRCFAIGCSAVVLATLLCSGLFRQVQADELRRTALVKAVAKAKAGVVAVTGSRELPRNDSTPDNMKRVARGMGAGVVIDPRGYILTSHHVVEDLDKIRVILEDGSEYPARLLKFQRTLDLALIKISPQQPMAVIPLGRSDDLMLGESVALIGNSYGYRHTVSRGVISAAARNVQLDDDRMFRGLIQTDAPMNPGNSGGPLINLHGEMIGMSIAIRSEAQNIGFAVPIDQILQSAVTLLQPQASPGFIATTIRAANGAPRAVVKSVDAGTPAQKAGLQTGDVIIQAGNLSVQNALDVQRAMVELKSGDRLAFQVQRRGKQHKVAFRTTGPLPLDEVWTTLGIRAAPTDAATLTRLGYSYRGGMVVSQVRGGSPADIGGVKPGDTLVAIGSWETLSQGNLVYIVRSQPYLTGGMTFSVIRGRQLVRGQITAAGN